MTDLNSVILRGRMARDASEGMKTSANGTAWGSFTIVVNKGEKQADGTWKDVGHFFEVKAFGKLYEKCVPHMTKGSVVVVKGSLSQETWEKDGKKNSKIVVIADEIYPTFSQNNNGEKGDAPAFKPKQGASEPQEEFLEGFPF